MRFYHSPPPLTAAFRADSRSNYLSDGARGRVLSIRKHLRAKDESHGSSSSGLSPSSHSKSFDSEASVGEDVITSLLAGSSSEAGKTVTSVEKATPLGSRGPGGSARGEG